MKITQNDDKINPHKTIKNIKTTSISLIALNIRSSQNVGSFFRTSDAMGINHIYIVGYTPSPIDKFKRPDKAIEKTALGAEKSVPYSQHKTLSPLLKKLKKENYTILALEQNINSIDYRKINKILKPKTKLSSSTTKLVKIALILGNEVTGVPASVLKNVDHIIEIPMRGIKESLNVSVATGIALSELTRDF